MQQARTAEMRNSIVLTGSHLAQQPSLLNIREHICNLFLYKLIMILMK